MKKFLLWCSLLALVGTSFAYTPNESDTKQLNNIKNVLSTVSNQDLRSYYQQFAQLQKVFASMSGEVDRTSYLLTNLRDFAYSQFSIQKNIAKQQSRKYKSDFFDTYKDNLLLDQEIYNNCLGRYNTTDNMSFANNFPTALTIAVRYRESTCGYLLPRNGNGPFQITSKNYGSGEITETLFLQTVQDFLDFSQNKINRYNERNANDNLSIDLSYTGAKYTDLRRFAALYNGLSWGTVYGEISPAAPKYFFEGYANEVWTGESKKDWIFSKYLKVVERELNN